MIKTFSKFVFFGTFLCRLIICRFIFKNELINFNCCKNYSKSQQGFFFFVSIIILKAFQMKRKLKSLSKSSQYAKWLGEVSVLKLYSYKEQIECKRARNRPQLFVLNDASHFSKMNKKKLFKDNKILHIQISYHKILKLKKC